MMISDNGGRRRGSDRRSQNQPIPFSERRCGSDRRNGGDRRSGKDRRSRRGFRCMIGSDRREAWARSPRFFLQFESE